MKIAICGKGGSGKSVVTALLARALLQKGYQVLVLDSDESNSSLYFMLGLKSPPKALMELVGGKKSVQTALRAAMSSESEQDAPNILQQDSLGTDQIPEDYIEREDGLSFAVIGKIQQSLEGCACPMGVLTREFLSKLVLKQDQVAIVDMEAGIEHFGRGLETSLDSSLIVVEPSWESLLLAARMKQMCQQSGIKSFGAILNKYPNEQVAQKLTSKLKDEGIQVLGGIPYDEEIFQAGFSGEQIRSSAAIDSMGKVADSMF
ncbi:MAG: P-loop NTPase [Desulfohalobiaceae bacterium]